MEDNRKIVCNASFIDYAHNPGTDLLFISNYEEYNNFTLKYEKEYPNLIIDYMPDIRFFTHKKQIYNSNNNINEISHTEDLQSKNPLLTIFTKKEKDLPKHLTLVIENLSKIYSINICTSSDINEIEKIISLSRLVICEEYIAHLYAILYQIPFISIGNERRVKFLLRNIGIEKLGFCHSKNLKYLINEWTVYEKMIHDSISNSKKYILDKLNFYNICDINIIEVLQ